MCEKIVAISLVVLLAGCQLHSSEPSGSVRVSGDYKAVADCFYLKIRNEGFWRVEHMDSQQMTEVIMGNAQYTAGTIRFQQVDSQTTEATLMIPHPGKFSPKIQECSGSLLPS